ncbi:hypothetical protein [Myroides phaeus]|uniref:CARD domain-containing protein n=1 Tax=Myroides phaeus TaxID=702745 RepID=A0A1G8DLY8_9FLAO|nr:hypothetical protein [Myroides phaeus]SDH58714.1 hypothetical protein SAMN05421818_10791 [Myroides phaeus]
MNDMGTVSNPYVISINKATYTSLGVVNPIEADFNIEDGILSIKPGFKNGAWNKQKAPNDRPETTEDDIYQYGNVAIGVDRVDSVPEGSLEIAKKAKLYVEGDTFVNGTIYSQTSTYADYVFEKYFLGESAIKYDYDFKDLAYVKNFVKENHHLPGVTPIGDLNKAANGYIVDYSKLVIEQLEKIEELYLHIIEQDEVNKKQQEHINNLELRMQKMEELLNNL